MSARRKLNSAYTTGSLLLGGFIGLSFQSWYAFAVGLFLLLMLNIEAGNIRLAGSRR
jgi:hypothetical protein